MPEGLLEVVGLLSIGYVLLILEIFVPGGVLGVLGGIAIIWGTVEAFELGTLWGLSSLALSVAVTVTSITLFFKSRAAKRLVLSDPEGKTWKAAESGLEDLLGKEGLTVSPLRPAGIAEIDGERVDVVADAEFLGKGVRVRVAEVEGNRVVVEPVEEEEAEAADDP